MHKEDKTKYNSNKKECAPVPVESHKYIFFYFILFHFYAHFLRNFGAMAGCPHESKHFWNRIYVSFLHTSLDSLVSRGRNFDSCKRFQKYSDSFGWGLSHDEWWDPNSISMIRDRAKISRVRSDWPSGVMRDLRYFHNAWRVIFL